MKTVDFRIEIFLTESIKNSPLYKEEEFGDVDIRINISDLIDEVKSVELTDEQYELLYGIWSEDGDKPDLASVSDDFRDVIQSLTRPYLDAIEHKYHEYGYTQEYTKKMMSMIDASVIPVFGDDIRKDDDVVDSVFANGIIYDILRDGRKKIVGCTNVDIEILNTDASIIDVRAFRKCTKLREVRLPNIVAVGAGAFCQCLNLHTVEFGSELKLIDEYAFSECHFLHNINFPQGMDMIEDGAFCGCVNLNGSIELPNTINHIGKNAFAYTPLANYSDNPLIYDPDGECEDEFEKPF